VGDVPRLRGRTQEKRLIFDGMRVELPGHGGLMHRFFLLLFVLLIAPGCTPRTAGAFLFGAALASSLHQEREVVYEREIVYVTTGPAEVYVPPPPSSRDSRLADPPPRVDAPAARQALAQAPVASCKERGLPAGYGHAKVTFGPDGHATKVLIDSPPNLSAEAVACVGEKLGAVGVAPFEGAPVVVGTTWYMR
jgi:hypothetical protein